MTPYTDRVFVDTGAFIAIGANNDDLHESATASFTRLVNAGAHLLTTNHVVDEVCTWMLRDRKLGHRGAMRFGRETVDNCTACTVGDLLTHPWGYTGLTLIYSTPDVERLAWEIFERHDRAGFTFTDCVSFAVMQLLGVGKAFTFDSHFDIMRFERV